MAGSAVPVDVFVMVLISALFHATWNLASRTVKGNFGVFW